MPSCSINWDGIFGKGPKINYAIYKYLIGAFTLTIFKHQNLTLKSQHLN